MKKRLISPMATLVWMFFIILWLLATAPVSQLLMRGIEKNPPIKMDSCLSADVIVLLGSGPPVRSPEYEKLQPTPLTLQRIRYAARLYQQCPLPILASGGMDESEVMASVLEEDYYVQVAWTENQSTNTWENALYSQLILEELGVSKVVLVTHAWHMARAAQSFRRVGFEVVPAPTVFTQRTITWKKPSFWMPDTNHLRRSAMALREYFGIVWYRLRYR